MPPPRKLPASAARNGTQNASSAVLEREAPGDEVDREPVGDEEPHRVGQRLAEDDAPRLAQPEQPAATAPGRRPSRVGSGGLDRLAVGQDVGPLLGRDPRMALGRVVEAAEQQQPDQAERAGDDEHRPPRAEAWNSHSTRTGAIAAPTDDPLSNSATAQPLSRRGNHSETAFVAPGQLAASPAPSRKRNAGERLQADRERRQHRRDGVPEHRDRQPCPRADAIEPLAGDGLPDRVGDAGRR